MVSYKKSTSERGKFKNKIHNALYKSDDIKDLLLGDITGKSASEVRKLFKERVKSHLFIDETIKDTNSYIYYDIRMPRLYENTKNCEIILYAVSHRDILDNYSKEGYYGNRADILSQMIENCLICDEDVAREFGIGNLKLDSVEIFNGRTLYGCQMTFSVPNFRWN